MAENSNIEWTDCTWNPVAGCTPVSPGCLICYAATMSHRLEAMGQKKYVGLTVLHNDHRTFNGKINLDHEAITKPLTWRKPRRIFVNSMSDLFHKDVPFEFIDKVFAVMALCPQHTFQVLTKRPERMAEYLTAPRERSVGNSTRCAVVNVAIHGFGQVPAAGWPLDRPTPMDWPLPNVWLGTSAEDQPAADERIPQLLKCPAAVRFLSCEPLLGPINLNRSATCDIHRPGGVRSYTRPLMHPMVREAKQTPGYYVIGGIDWVIVGGESGPGARVCYTNWIDNIVAQCRSADVPVFVKQLGSNHRCIDDEFGDVEIKLKDAKGGDIDEFPINLRIREFPEVQHVA